MMSVLRVGMTRERKLLAAALVSGFVAALTIVLQIQMAPATANAFTTAWATLVVLKAFCIAFIPFHLMTR
ncbi:MAG: hypothetical protein A3K18_13520 [Lentisphaerae bacterium RIFOXYA12_64_32]|nr:MAG: hypothetical protein A3K18_13520 [Lentisphaerae bacterium RIFOXYA12_64_32]